VHVTQIYQSHTTEDYLSFVQIEIFLYNISFLKFQICDDTNFLSGAHFFSSQTRQISVTDQNPSNSWKK